MEQDMCEFKKYIKMTNDLLYNSLFDYFFLQKI